VILDFIRKLKTNSKKLDVLGDGNQQKPYLHINDLVSAMLHVSSCNINEKVFPVNVGPNDNGVSVRFIADSVVRSVSPNASICFGESSKGWIGDVPQFRYSVNRLKECGWAPRFTSQQAVLTAIDEIAFQEGERTNCNER